MSKIILLGLSLTFLSWGVNAHNPDLSSTILSKQENKWVLQVRSALTAYEYEIHQHFGEDAYKTPEEFQALVLQHLKENIAIQFGGGNKVILKNGVVKLGHETNTIFEVIGVPENFAKLKFKNSSFKNISRNQSALIIFKEGLTKKQFILNSANDHTADLMIKNAEFFALNSTKVKKSNMISPNLYLAIGVLGILAILIFLKFRPSKVKI